MRFRRHLKKGTSSSRLLYECSNIKYALDVICRVDMFGIFILRGIRCEQVENVYHSLLFE